MLEARPLWERPVLREVAGGTLRPGGFVLTDRAAEAMDMLPGWKVLDVGCGLGTTVSRLRSRYGASAYGVEPASAQIERGSGLSGIIQAQGDCLPFADAAFTAVFCECALSLFPAPKKGLEEFFRVLKPGGYLALSDLCASQLSQEVSGSCADRAVPLAHTRTMVEEIGFSLERVEDHTRLLTDLAARLLLAGENGDDCGCNRGDMGYFLMIARKKG